MGSGDLTRRLEVMSELKAEDNERYKRTGEAGMFSDVRQEEEKLMKEMERTSGERMTNYSGERYKPPRRTKGMTQLEMRQLQMAELEKINNEEK